MGQRKKWAWPWAMGAPQNFWPHCNISAMAKASELKFRLQLGFAKAHHKISPRGKSGCGPGQGKLHKILESPFNISATVEASDFKFGMQLEFAKSHHKIPPRRKEGRGPKLGELPNIWGFPLIFMQWLKVSTSNLIHSVGGQFGPS